MYLETNSKEKIIKMIEDCTYNINPHDLLSDIFECGAISISNRFNYNDLKEENYKKITNKYSKTQINKIREIWEEIFDLLLNQNKYGFSDYLGEIYMGSYTSNNKTGQFFTPYHISKLCAASSITKEDVEKKINKNKVLTITEPSCGSGGMIVGLADVLWSEYNFDYTKNFFVKCGDIDRRCVHMTYIQLSLLGVPAIVCWHNKLTNEVWEEWKTPSLILQWNKFRSLLK